MMRRTVLQQQGITMAAFAVLAAVALSPACGNTKSKEPQRNGNLTPAPTPPYNPPYSPAPTTPVDPYRTTQQQQNSLYNQGVGGYTVGNAYGDPLVEKARNDAVSDYARERQEAEFQARLWGQLIPGALGATANIAVNLFGDSSSSSNRGGYYQCDKSACAGQQRARGGSCQTAGLPRRIGNVDTSPGCAEQQNREIDRALQSLHPQTPCILASMRGTPQQGLLVVISEASFLERQGIFDHGDYFEIQINTSSGGGCRLVEAERIAGCFARCLGGG